MPITPDTKTPCVCLYPINPRKLKTHRKDQTTPPPHRIPVLALSSVWPEEIPLLLLTMLLSGAEYTFTNLLWLFRLKNFRGLSYTPWYFSEIAALDVLVRAENGGKETAREKRKKKETREKINREKVSHMKEQRKGVMIADDHSLVKFGGKRKERKREWRSITALGARRARVYVLFLRSCRYLHIYIGWLRLPF